jgi:hypothetical protein
MRGSHNALFVDPVAVIFEGYDFAIDDIAFLASELQALERTPMSIDVGEVAGDEIPHLPALCGTSPAPHAMASRLPYSFHRPCHKNKMRTYSR